MRVRRKEPLVWLILLLGGSLLSGCASIDAPRGYLSPVEAACADPFGGWIEVEYAWTGEPTDRIRGEFIAMDDDSLYVLAGDGLQAVALPRVRKFKLTYFDPESLAPVVWVGTVSTLSHGFGFLISAPIWILFGTALANQHIDQAKIEGNYPAGEEIHGSASDYRVLDLRAYARFPQGPPPGLRHLDLQPKMDYSDYHREVYSAETYLR